MANALPTTGASPGNIRQNLGTNYTTPVGSLMASDNAPDVHAPADAREQARRVKKRKRDKIYYRKNRERILLQQKDYAARRPEVHLEASRKYVSRNREKQNAANKASRRKLRLEVITVYGSVCACCGEPEEAFLEAHHVNGGGNAHRKELGGGGSRLYSWLKKNRWPKDFGLLCSNCNKAEFNRGICPHRLKRLQERAA